jgi:flagellar biosynthesis/type III secretory pathway protein FliH
VRCADCGETLDIDDSHIDVTQTLCIKIKPCARCKEASRDEGYDDGHNDGHSEGYHEGYQDGLAEENDQ